MKQFSSNIFFMQAVPPLTTLRHLFLKYQWLPKYPAGYRVFLPASEGRQVPKNNSSHSSLANPVPSHM